MRFATTTLFENLTRGFQGNLIKILDAQEKISSGRKINKPSDDAIAITQILDYKLDINRNDQYKKNIDNATSFLELNDSVLNSVSGIFMRLKEIALSGVNTDQDHDSREALSKEVLELRDALFNHSNTTLFNRYIFSGYKTKTQAFDSSYNYRGDTNYIEVMTNNNIKVKQNIPGDSAFFDKTKWMTSTLTLSSDAVGTGTLDITAGSGNAMQIAIDLSNDEPEEIRDTINAPMSALYATSATTIGSGTLTLKAGSGDPVTLDVNATAANDTPATLVTAINALNMGIDARLATDQTTSEVRILFRPTTPGTAISIEVLDDDGNNLDTSGLSALLHTSTRSNLAKNALGIEAFVINTDSGKMMHFRPVDEDSSFSITVDDDDLTDTDSSGLSQLYHASSSSTNLTKSISFFDIFEHLANSLSNSDQQGISASIHLIDGAQDTVINSMTEIGARMNYLYSERDENEDITFKLKGFLSKLEDADIFEVTSELARTDVALQALRNVGGRITFQSLLDFLR